MVDMPVVEKMEYFQEVMNVLHLYEIMPDRSPMIVFTECYQENNRMHLLALRQICKMCLEMVDTRFESLELSDLPTRFNEVNRHALEDSFEAYVLSADQIELEILEQRLEDCVDKLNQLIIHS